VQDVTTTLEHYRECVRHLWNVGFRYIEETVGDWDLVDQFYGISDALFVPLVLYPLDKATESGTRSGAWRPEPLNFLTVTPSGSGATIYINREQPACGYWDDPVKTVTAGEADLRFIGYFDFDLRGPRDLEYYRVRIAEWPAQSHLVGRDALISVRQGAVFLVDEPSSDA
jgi:hypothetical protein